MKRIAISLGIVASVLLSGCVTVHKDVTSLNELGTDSVLLVGRIELVPPLSPDSQNIKIGFDPLGAEDSMLGRAVLMLSDKPVYEDYTSNAINPLLEQTWFVAVPRSQRYMVRGSVMMEYSHRAVNRRQVDVSQVELLMPAPIEFDMKSGDKAVYIGTLRLHRDEFHEVTKAEILDHYGKALSEYRAKFGSDAPLRRALARPVMDKVSARASRK